MVGRFLSNFLNVSTFKESKKRNEGKGKWYGSNCPLFFGHFRLQFYLSSSDLCNLTFSSVPELIFFCQYRKVVGYVIKITFSLKQWDCFGLDSGTTVVMQTPQRIILQITFWSRLEIVASNINSSSVCCSFGFWTTIKCVESKYDEIVYYQPICLLSSSCNLWV